MDTILRLGVTTIDTHTHTHAISLSLYYFNRPFYRKTACYAASTFSV